MPKLVLKNGIEIDVQYDDDGFPIIHIDTGNDFFAQNQRPTVEIHLNEQLIHEMFDEDDERWNEFADVDDDVESNPD